MKCVNCEIVKKNPSYRLFNPACLYCGARIIQVIGALAITRADCRDRRRAMLMDWVAQGHAEAEIRALVDGPLAISPEPVVEVVEPVKKPKSARRLG